ncbi:ABC transporter substrate-binding protein [Phytohabitans kaempferiae]|uniref:PotD/PotF family extracellular solute-binding protein n=1 Tax=Phytohabitans kaempferiae TaxID=1620943 RepID=A0ABV6MAY1_9ACTN
MWDKALAELTPTFNERYGANLVNTVDGQNGLTKIQQAPKAYDLAWLTADKAAVGLKNGTLQPIDTARVAAHSNIYPSLLNGFTQDGKLPGVPVSWGAQAILYRKDKVPFEITKWADLWRPELRGQVAIGAMPSVAGVWALMAGAQAFGSGIDDFDAGWMALEQLKPNVQYQYTLSSDPVNKLADGSLLATITFADLGVPLASRNVAVVIPDEGAPWSSQPITIPAESGNVDKVYEFINFMLEAEQQEAWTRTTQVAPANSGITLSSDVQSKLLEGPEVAARMWEIDWLTIGENVTDWTKKWQETFA